LAQRPLNRTARRGIRILLKLFKDQRGGEVVEYALVIGLIVVGAIATITCAGQKILSRWNSINSHS
jgi:Flp pilus assembly pilin Flp